LSGGRKDGDQRRGQFTSRQIHPHSQPTAPAQRATTKNAAKNITATVTAHPAPRHGAIVKPEVTGVQTKQRFVEHEIYPHEALVERTATMHPDLAAAIRAWTIELRFYACNFPE